MTDDKYDSSVSDNFEEACKFAESYRLSGAMGEAAAAWYDALLHAQSDGLPDRVMNQCFDNFRKYRTAMLEKQDACASIVDDGPVIEDPVRWLATAFNARGTVKPTLPELLDLVRNSNLADLSSEAFDRGRAWNGFAYITRKFGVYALTVHIYGDPSEDSCERRVTLPLDTSVAQQAEPFLAVHPEIDHQCEITWDDYPGWFAEPDGLPL